MRFALLGADSDSLALARAVVDSSEHELVWASDVAAAARVIAGWGPGIHMTEDWESLLLGTVADAVIVGAAAEQDARADQLRKLVQAGVPLLLAHPLHDSMLVYYELDMIHREGQGLMLPYLPSRWHPAIAKLVDLTSWDDADGIGAWEQVVFERRQDDRSRAAVLNQFVRDVDTLRYVCGDVRKVGSMVAAGAEPLANLGVQMSGEGPGLIRWSVLGAAGHPGGTLTLVGAEGQAVLSMPAGNAAWELHITRGASTTTETFADWNAPRAALATFVRQVRGEPTAAAPTWADAARSLEIREALERSIRRGRTIELQDEEYSEQATFKGIMAAGGCGLLMLALVAVFFGELGRAFGVPHADKWPYMLLALMGGFLLLQTLRLAFPREESTPRGA